MATPAEVASGRTMGGGPRRGTRRWPKGPTQELEPLVITAKRLPVPRAPAQAKRAALPTTVLEPVVITAQRLPTPAPVASSPAWLKLIKAVPAGANAMDMFEGKKA